jgi:hypothetical protein
MGNAGGVSYQFQLFFYLLHGLTANFTFTPQLGVGRLVRRHGIC